MELILLFFILIVIDYVLFIALLIYGFDKVKTFETADLKPITTFSVIVPFRNEANNFLDLLQSISQLDYPKNLYEIIVVDDFSEDQSVKIFNKWRFENGLIQTTLLENLRLTNSPKKDAISRAIPVVKYDWIITTDADCVVNRNWLKILDNYIQNHEVEMIAGAVSISTKQNPLQIFQYLDLLSLQGTTIGSFGLKEPFMCNGANFGYTKKFFLELKGFDGNNNMASGDDVFLLQKAIRSNANKVHYLKHSENIVHTKPEKSLKSLFMQRVRWASKTGSYDSDFAKALAVIVLLMNIGFVGFLIFYISGFKDFFTIETKNILIVSFIIKFVIDYILLWKTNKFIENKKFFFPLLSSLIYPFYCAIVGIYSLFGSFFWKGRRFKK